MKPSYLQFLYRLYAPIYDRCLGGLFRDGHRKGIGCLAEGAKLRVLDVGIGTGLSLAHYRPEHEMTGIDLSPAMLSIARRKCVESPAAEVSLVEMDAGKLAFPAAHFDAVLLFYSLTVVSDPAAVVAEAARVLKPDGDLIVVSHSASSHGMVRVIEKAVSPLAKLMGFRSDLRVGDCLNEISGIEVVGIQSANALGYWKVFPLQEASDRRNMRPGVDNDRLIAGLLHVILPLAAGGMIYLLFRETDLLVFRWAEFMGLSDAVEKARYFGEAIHPPNLVVYSLPGALWLYAFVALMAILWRDKGDLRARLPWIVLPLCVAAGSEGAQWLGLTDGTFDWGDVGLYVIAVSAALPCMGLSRQGQVSDSRPSDLRFRHRLSFACALCFSLIIGGADVMREM